jgi:large subunit ribosomal protein L9
MEVILTKDVQAIGHVGQVIKVKDGYARNFLFPNQLAVPVTAANIQKLEQQKQKKLQELAQLKSESQAFKDKLEALSLTIPVLVQEDGKFYGSVSAQDIAKALKDEGLEVDKHKLDLPEPLKSLGIYEVGVKLHPEIQAKVKVWIVKK